MLQVALILISRATAIETCSEARKGTEKRFWFFHTSVIMAQIEANCLFQYVALSKE